MTFPRLIALGAPLLLLLAGPAPAEPIHLKGSATATAPLAALAWKLPPLGLSLQIDAESNTTDAIGAVAERTADCAAATRAVTAEERATYAKTRLIETPIGLQILAVAVSEDVWSGGIRALDKEQLRRIYEREVKNWKELGGPDRPIQFFCPEPGHGVWELFVTWLYGDVRKAPLGTAFEPVNGGEAARNTVQFHAGGISVLSPVWIDGRGTFALGVKEGGEILPPTVKAAVEQKYPLARTLSLVTADRPAGDLKKLIDVVLSPLGDAALHEAEFLPLDRGK